MPRTDSMAFVDVEPDAGGTLVAMGYMLISACIIGTVMLRGFFNMLICQARAMCWVTELRGAGPDLLRGLFFNPFGAVSSSGTKAYQHQQEPHADEHA